MKQFVLTSVLAIGMATGLLAENAQPNIILMMADDLGYGDTGFNGNTLIQTPHMDTLASRGVVLTHFYSGNSVCSPTRGTCLTGRHHDRYGIYTANNGHLPKQEVSLAQMLKEKGYTTGHFGKWHLGTLSPTMSAKGKRRKPELNYAPPWERSYDRSFVTESAVNTWNPGTGKRAKDNPFYENGVALDGRDPSLAGGAARVVVDRAVPFIEKAVAEDRPFLAVVWFHAPHEDIEAGPDYLNMYEGHGEAAHFYGCITELDEQVGRIVQVLEKNGVADNTLIFFCSDNGPEGKAPKGRRMGSTDGLRGRKRALYDGGVRVPAFVVWPGKIEPGTSIDAILSTLDYFPTIQNVVGYKMPDARPIDGEDILPVLTGKAQKRTRSIPFRYSGGKSSLVKDGYKFMLPSRELYDLSKDRPEEKNLLEAMPEKASEMERDLVTFFESVEKSHSGGDYNDPSFKPVEPWKPLKTEERKNKK
jgi:arylsulfatase A-like enzyme